MASAVGAHYVPSRKLGEPPAGPLAPQSLKLIYPCQLLEPAYGCCIKFRVHDVAAPGALLPEAALGRVPQQGFGAVPSPASARTWLSQPGELGLERVWATSVLPLDGVATPVASASGAPHLLALSTYLAFYDHRTLRLDPSVLWLTICAGFRSYASRFPTALKARLGVVDVAGGGGAKATIDVFDPAVTLDSWIDWPKQLQSIAAKIEARFGAETTELFATDFSGSSPTDKAVSSILLMDVFSDHVSLRLRAGCGFPAVELAGTLADFDALRAKTRALLDKFELPAGTEPDGLHLSISSIIKRAIADPQHLGKWLRNLDPVLERLCDAAKGSPDVAFFGSSINHLGQSSRMGAPVTGWVRGWVRVHGSRVRTNV